MKNKEILIKAFEEKCTNGTPTQLYFKLHTNSDNSISVSLHGFEYNVENSILLNAFNRDVKIAILNVLSSYYILFNDMSFLITKKEYDFLNDKLLISIEKNKKDLNNKTLNKNNTIINTMFAKQNEKEKRKVITEKNEAKN